MPKNGDVHTVHRNGQWVNTVECESGHHGPYATKEKAVNAGRRIAVDNRAEHLIHNMDGTIHERNTYGHDPRNIPG
jgi:hypothetical protein